MISDVSEQDFQAKVVERSKEVPVVVDFWAEWCGPCRTLGPALEDAVRKRDGDVELAKLDTDANQAIAREFGIQSIPAVKAFKDGKVVAEFVGADPPAQIEAFLNQFVPSKADRLAESGDEDSLRQALELDPRHAPSAVGLGRILLGRGETDEALEVLRPFPTDFVADGLMARLELSQSENGTETGRASGRLLRLGRRQPRRGARAAAGRSRRRAGSEAQGRTAPGDGRDLHRARR